MSLPASLSLTDHEHVVTTNMEYIYALNSCCRLDTTDHRIIFDARGLTKTCPAQTASPPLLAGAKMSAPAPAGPGFALAAPSNSI